VPDVLHPEKLLFINQLAASSRKAAVSSRGLTALRVHRRCTARLATQKNINKINALEDLLVIDRFVQP
jgi:hypothetical protein